MDDDGPPRLLVRIYPPIMLQTFSALLRTVNRTYKKAVVSNGDGCYEIWSRARKDESEGLELELENG